MDRARISQLRPQLLQTEHARQAALQVLLGLGPMIQGSFVTQRRRGGKPTCRCAVGAPHASKGLSRSEGGRTRSVYVPAGDEVAVAGKAGPYRQWRPARAALRRLAAQTDALADALRAALTEPYPAPRGPAAPPHGAERRQVGRVE
jgi:hypothetical protein